MIKQIKLYFSKHDYKYQGEISVTGPKITYPVFKCDKCGDRLELDPWQMRSLPRSMGYGCKGVKL